MPETTSPPRELDPGAPFSHCLMHGHGNLHEAVEHSRFLRALRAGEANRQGYVGFLANVLHDLDLVEPVLEAAPSPLDSIDFTSVARRRAVRGDLDAFGLDFRPSEAVRQHRPHLERIAAEAPALLVSHAALRYLAIMFGGRLRAERLARMWGPETPLRMYQFDADPKAVRDAFLAQLDAFDQRLDLPMRARLRQELVTAWEFAGDMLGENIRPLSAGSRRTQPATLSP